MLLLLPIGGAAAAAYRCATKWENSKSSYSLPAGGTTVLPPLPTRSLTKNILFNAMKGSPKC
jgi:hypothetical protein